MVAGSGSASAGRSAGRLAGRLNAPRPALVETAPGGTPHVVNREQVALVREEWRVVDRWWTDEPVDRAPRVLEEVLAREGADRSRVWTMSVGERRLLPDG